MILILFFDFDFFNRLTTVSVDMHINSTNLLPSQRPSLFRAGLNIFFRLFIQLVLRGSHPVVTELYSGGDQCIAGLLTPIIDDPMAILCQV
jgi:hypothetical protein